jgi:predicted transcriptional regulator of viral defense system
MKRALGSKALSLLERWEAEGTRVVSIAEVRERLGSSTSPKAASQIVRRLSDGGFLKRVGRGFYAVQPVAWMGESAPDVAVVLAAISKRGGRFFIGFDTAAGFYGWHPETYGVVTIAGPRGSRIRPTKVEGTHIRTVTVDDSTFAEGVATVRWRDVQLPISDRNRTVVDAVSKVELIGGYPDVLRLLARAAKDPKVDQIAVAELCAHRRTVRLQKRLGFLCERAGWSWSEPAISLLRAGWPSSHRAVLDIARRREGGHWDSRWGLVVSVPETLLHAEAGVR